MACLLFPSEALSHPVDPVGPVDQSGNRQHTQANIELTATLAEFLGNVDQPSAHQRFWADDLIYTSSAGKRFGKAEILAGMQSSEPVPATTRYSSEDLVIRHVGAAAILTFRLVAEPLRPDGDSAPQPDYYLNSGVFVKRARGWQAIHWQATKVPAERNTEAP